MEMWENYKTFQITVKSHWALHLGETIDFPVPEGNYNGRIASDVSGFEIRKDNDFISARPCYVFMDDPHPEMLKLWSARQVINDRDDCRGYVPSGLLKVMEYSDEESVDSADYTDISACSEDDELPLPNDVGNCFIRDCMFLGSKTSSSRPLMLKEVIRKELYGVHKTEDDELVGYLTTVGIWGWDAMRFHSDEGYYEVDVTLPCDSSNSNTFFIALLGEQNSIEVYSLDRLENRVDWKDLEWFNRNAKKYFVPEDPPEYINLCSSPGSYSCLDPGVYVIEEQVKPRKWTTGYDDIQECGEYGEDNLGRKFTFPSKRFRFCKIELTDGKQKCKVVIKVPYGGYLSLWDGNLSIEMKPSPDLKTQDACDKEYFRMYTNLNSIGPHIGDMSEYDKDPEKTLIKLDLAIANARKKFYALPPKEQCCEECRNSDFHQRCPNEKIIS